MPLTDEMKKAIEEIVDEATSQMFAKTEEEAVEKSEAEDESKEEAVEKSEVEAESEEIEKSEDSEDESEESESEEKTEKSAKGQESKNTSANGGKDEIKSGTPKSGKEAMKKSLEELSDHLDSDELELIAAWREETSNDEVEKSQPVIDAEDIKKSFNEAISAQTEEFKKALDSKDAVIKSMQDQINKMATKPAYDKRSLDSLEPLEKAHSEGETISKAQVLDTMLDLQKAGKDVTSHHVAEFEATGNISNPRTLKLIMDACKRA